MWNFLVSGLTLGCTLVLYDGSPLKDPSILWRMVDELGITIFGTSAKYLDHLSVGVPFLRNNAAFIVIDDLSETLQTEGTPSFDDSSPHLLYRIALGTSTLRLRIPRHTSQCASWINYR